MKFPLEKTHEFSHGEYMKTVHLQIFAGDSLSSAKNKEEAMKNSVEQLDAILFNTFLMSPREAQLMKDTHSIMTSVMEQIYGRDEFTTFYLKHRKRNPDL